MNTIWLDLFLHELLNNLSDFEKKVLRNHLKQDKPARKVVRGCKRWEILQQDKNPEQL